MPMTLRGEDGTEFELSLTGQRFEQGRDGEEDEVWPEIVFRVATEEDSWEESAPCMNLHELHALAEWLEAVATGRPELEEVDILEANLAFSLDEEGGDEVLLRIGFELEGAPAWAVLDPPTDTPGITMRVRRARFGPASRSLREDLRRIEEGVTEEEEEES